MVRVKFCGLTNLEDAAAAVELGADLLGFNFYPKSPRYISAQTCRSIVQELAVTVATSGRPVQFVGVFVNQPPQEVTAILQDCGLDLAQLSGDETAEDLQRIGPAAFKAIRLGRDTSLEEAIQAIPPRHSAPSFLVDAGVPGQYGGTGQVADWKQARLVAGYFPLLLAGGLTPENVAQAIAEVQPWGVDVASGIESAPGRKDARLMEWFMEAAKGPLTADG
jgi:phosphoribosylanthranilate isomerase